MLASPSRAAVQLRVAGGPESSARSSLARAVFTASPHRPVSAMARTRGLGSPRVRVLVAALLISAFAAPVEPTSLRLPTFLGSNAVLQRAPARAAVWGWAAPGALVTVELTKEPAEEGGVESDAIANGGAGDADRIRPPRAVLATARTSAAAGTGKWIVRLPPQPASHGPFTLRILANSSVAGDGGATVESTTVTDLAFGDVWLCAGQSNMQFTVAASFDAATAIAESATVGDGIRIATVAMTAADVERDDVESATLLDPAYAKNGQKSAWAKAFPDAFNPPAAPDPTLPYGGWSDMGWFSAACWFHGLELYVRSFKEVPVGLISAAWGGQAIEQFSSREALADETCGGTVTVGNGPSGSSGFGFGSGRRETWTIVPTPDVADFDSGADESLGVFPESFGPSALWNGMIAPLLNTRLKGVAWYQGEANWATPRSYACRFPAMIADWRRRFEAPGMPFAYVQLAAYPKRDYAPLRGAQSFLTSTMEAVAYAVAVDLGDPSSPWDCVHPRRKREVGRRLALAALGIDLGRRIRGPEFINEAPALDLGDVATKGSIRATGRSIRATFRLARGAESPVGESLTAAGTAGCDVTGTARCCDEAPFELALDPPPPPRFDPPAVGAMLGVPGPSRDTLLTGPTAMLGTLNGTSKYLRGDSEVLRDATARDARIACARLGPETCAGFRALWNTLERGPMPDDVTLDAIYLVPRPPAGRIAAEWDPSPSWTSVAFRGSDDPWVRATSFEVDAIGNGRKRSETVRNGRRRTLNGDESGWIATAELSAEIVTAETVVRGARYAWERYPQCALYDGNPKEENGGVAAAPFCFDLARNAPCAPTNPRNP